MNFYSFVDYYDSIFCALSSQKFKLLIPDILKWLFLFSICRSYFTNSDWQRIMWLKSPRAFFMLTKSGQKFTRFGLSYSKNFWLWQWEIWMIFMLTRRNGWKISRNLCEYFNQFSVNIDVFISWIWNKFLITINIGSVYTRFFPDF